jgi:hypothetical protein
MENELLVSLIKQLPELGLSTVFLVLFIVERVNMKKAQEKHQERQDKFQDKWFEAYVEQTKVTIGVQKAVEKSTNAVEELKKVIDGLMIRYTGSHKR